MGILKIASVSDIRRQPLASVRRRRLMSLPRHHVALLASILERRDFRDTVTRKLSLDAAKTRVSGTRAECQRQRRSVRHDATVQGPRASAAPLLA